jgi:hypothetical protein
MTEVYSIEKKLKTTIFNFLLKYTMDSTEAKEITLNFIKDGEYRTLKKILNKSQFKKVMDEYDNFLMMTEAEKLTKDLPKKRIRTQTQNPSKKYFDSVISQQNDCGKNGGFIAGSGYHYDRHF